MSRAIVDVWAAPGEFAPFAMSLGKVASSAKRVSPDVPAESLWDHATLSSFEAM
jgi:hypothetical protein